MGTPRVPDKSGTAAAAAAGGWGGIRTHGGLAPTAVFKTAALNHSATHPRAFGITPPRPAVQAKRRAELSGPSKLVPYKVASGRGE